MHAQTAVANHTPRDVVTQAAPKRPLFTLGQACATPGALDALEKNQQDPARFLARHVTGDWLEMCAQDQQTNSEALIHGARVFSAYAMNDGKKLWVITESDRSVTTLLLPSEY